MSLLISKFESKAFSQQKVTNERALDMTHFLGYRDWNYQFYQKTEPIRMKTDLLGLP